MASAPKSGASARDVGGDPDTVAALTVLLWLGRTDGPLNGSELATIARISSANAAGIHAFAHAIDRAAEITFEELRIAFERLIASPSTRRRSLLRAAVRVAIADGELTAAEDQALRLVADACAGGVDGERSLASELATLGRRLAPPSDLSSPEWWSARAPQGPRARPASGWPIESTRAFREVQDLALLGLGPGADAAAVRAAFRRVSLLLHPDRLQDVDDKTRSQAARDFQSAREAYERLTEA